MRSVHSSFAISADATMEPLLFLCHRLPFPPSTGDKVRSYHFLVHLAKRYRIFLGTFIDDPSDREHVQALAPLCAGVYVEELHPAIRRLTSASALLTGDAVTLAYFGSRGLRAWVHSLVRRENIRQALAFSSPMAQYVCGLPGMRCIADFVDVDSAKWDEYARRRSWPASWLYRREASRLRSFEVRVAGAADAIVLVTAEEARLFADLAPKRARRIATIPNGVDSEYFRPSVAFASPFAADECPIVFTGAMDYWPNIDGVLWFAREILPRIRMHEPRARFHVVGMNPAPTVRSLASDSAVTVTGRVADVRPYLHHARVVVAPLRVARGIQNKVLEAMAMAKPIVMTPGTAAALSARPGSEIETAAEPEEFSARVLGLMADPARATQLGNAARARVLAEYGWESSLARLDALLASCAPAVPVRGSAANEVPMPLAAE